MPQDLFDQIHADAQKKQKDIFDTMGQDGTIPPGGGPLKGVKDTRSAGERFISSLRTAMNPVPMLETFGKVMLAAGAPPGSEIRREARKDVYQGFIQPTVETARKAGSMAWEAQKDIQSGHPIKAINPALGAFDYAAATLLPGIGPAIMAGEQQMEKGDVAGGAGTWSGTLLPFIFGEAGKAGTKRIPSTGIPSKLYKAAITPGFDSGTSLARRAEISKRGLGHEITAPDNPNAMKSPPTKGVKPTIATESALKDLSKRVSADHLEVIKRIARATDQGMKIDTDWVLKPIDAMIENFKKSADPDAANVLQDLRDRFKKDHPSAMDPDEVQILKQNTDALLNDPVFKENAQLKGRQGGVKKLRDGMREMLETVAPVQQLNWEQYTDIKLSEAINHALKNKPEMLDKWAAYLGGGAVVMAMMGHGAYAEASIVAAAVRAALRNPTTMTGIARLLDQSGVHLPEFLSKTGKIGSALAVTGTARAEGHRLAEERRSAPPTPTAEAPAGPPTARTGAGQQAAPAGGRGGVAQKSATLDHVRQYAQQKGISEQQARDEFQQAGWTVK